MEAPNLSSFKRLHQEPQDATFQTIIPGEQSTRGFLMGQIIDAHSSPVGALQNKTLSDY